MNLDNDLFDSIQLLAEASPRRRMHYDLRTEADAPAGVGHDNWKDQSQRILKGVQIPMGVYHTTRCIEPGSVIFEAKDRPYDPESTEEFLNV